MPYFDEVHEGDELPPLITDPVTRQQLVEWCAAENDYNPIHYDEAIAARMSLPGTPIQGTYRFALMGHVVERWLGEMGTLRRATASYRGYNLSGEAITCRARVTKCVPSASGGTVELDIWVENAQGDRTTTGVATVELPGR